jgi:hypothetical protein
MVWLYRSPIPVGMRGYFTRSNDYYLLLLRLEEGDEGGGGGGQQSTPSGVLRLKWRCDGEKKALVSKQRKRKKGVVYSRGMSPPIV